MKCRVCCTLVQCIRPVQGILLSPPGRLVQDDILVNSGVGVQRKRYNFDLPYGPYKCLGGPRLVLRQLHREITVRPY